MKTFEEVVAGSVPSLAVFINSGETGDNEVNEVIEELRSKYGERVNVLRVDGSYDHRLAHQFDIHTYPSYVLIKEGEELMRESGKKSVAELSALIERAF